MVHINKIVFGLFLFCFTLAAQSPVCIPSAGNVILRSEGLAESAGDLVLTCSGARPGVPSIASLSVYTNSVNITNHLSTGNVPDVVVSATAGSVQQPNTAIVQLVGTNVLNIGNIQFTAGTDTNVTIRVSNIRLNVNSAAGKTTLLSANLTASGLVLLATQIPIAGVASGLLSSDVGAGIYCSGSPLPSTVTMQNLFATGTSFGSTRVTEGFGSAFIAKDAASDAGTRIMIRYANLPSTTRLFVPDTIAGSDALQPTAGGDLGTPQSPGMYASSSTGSLLLSRVKSPNADGSGGSLAYQIPSGGTGPITLSGASELTISNGSAMAVYEVIDSNPAVIESAQVQTFVTLTSVTAGGTYGQETLTFAPISTVGTATMTDPVPRFAAVAPPLDCSVLGDCKASYFPSLHLTTSSLTLTSASNGAPITGFFTFQNTGGGIMPWTATVTYQNGNGWIYYTPTSGVNGGTVFVRANPANLSPGVYNATVTVDAGPIAGSISVPVTFTVGQPLPLISSVSNAANATVTTLVAGSFASIYGTSLSGNNVTVSLDGMPAATTYIGATQINLVVPDALAGRTSAMMTVSADGRSSAPTLVTLVNSAPAIFPRGILNQDSSLNASTTPAASGTTLQIFMTGLPPVTGATVKIGNRTLPSEYSGPAPGIAGLQQVNVKLPADLTGTAQLSVCSSEQVCTPAYAVAIR